LRNCFMESCRQRPLFVWGAAKNVAQRDSFGKTSKKRGAEEAQIHTQHVNG
jgi:hypothetical protein